MTYLDPSPIKWDLKLVIRSGEMGGAGPRLFLGDGTKLLPVLYNSETGVSNSDSRIAVIASKHSPRR
jgi:hypothetical protein